MNDDAIQLKATNMNWNSSCLIPGLMVCLLIFGGDRLAASLSPGSFVNSVLDDEAAQKTKPKADLSQLAWISGHWKGEAMGGTFEETWNPPMAGSIMGMFKFVENGKIVFYEFLTIVPENDSIVLRLKHFDPALKGWETKDESVEFKLLSVSENEIVFDGLRFKKLAEDRMEIKVKMKQGDEEQELVFKCERSRLKK